MEQLYRFVPQADMCRGVDGSLLTDEQEVINRWKQHFDEHLNGARAEQQAEDNDYNGERNDEAVPVPTMNKVKEAIKQLKNNKAAGINVLAPELLKFGPGKLIRIVLWFGFGRQNNYQTNGKMELYVLSTKRSTS